MITREMVLELLRGNMFVKADKLSKYAEGYSESVEVYVPAHYLLCVNGIYTTVVNKTREPNRDDYIDVKVWLYENTLTISIWLGNKLITETYALGVWCGYSANNSSKNDKVGNRSVEALEKSLFYARTLSDFKSIERCER